MRNMKLHFFALLMSLASFTAYAEDSTSLLHSAAKERNTVQPNAYVAMENCQYTTENKITPNSVKGITHESSHMETSCGSGYAAYGLKTSYKKDNGEVVYAYQTYCCPIKVDYKKLANN